MEVNDPVPIPGSQPAVMEPVYNNNAPVQATAPVQTVPVQATPTFQSGGKTGKFFDGITLTDIIVGTLVIGSLTLAVMYYRSKIKHSKIEYPELRADVDKLKETVNDIEQPPTQIKDTFA